MQKWEYCLISIDEDEYVITIYINGMKNNAIKYPSDEMLNVNVSNILGKLGQEGWELTAVDDWLYLKRPLP